MQNITKHHLMGAWKSQCVPSLHPLFDLPSSPRIFLLVCCLDLSDAGLGSLPAKEVGGTRGFLFCFRVKSP